MIGIDGFSATILAAEGIADATVLLNGPLGCKYYQGRFADRWFPKDIFPGRYGHLCDLSYFGQPRVPCTFLDEEDYIDGAQEKLEAALPIVAKRASGPIIIVNSPGAALIGDDIGRSVRELGLTDRAIIIESPAFSAPASQGFEETMMRVVEALVPKRAPAPDRSVNLLGLSIMHKHWQGTVLELKRVLGLMGLDVKAVPGAGSSTDELRSSVDASLNIVLCPEYGAKLARYYNEEHGTSYLVPSKGAPLGFDATECFIREVASAMKMDPSPALRDLQASMNRAAQVLARCASRLNSVKGSTFALRADSSIAYPLTEWLYSYMGMWPEAVELLPRSDPLFSEKLRSFLETIGAIDALMRPVESTPADTVFAEGRLVEQLKEEGQCIAGVDIAMPEGEHICFAPRTHWGSVGPLYLLEEMVNDLVWGSEDSA